MVDAADLKSLYIYKNHKKLQLNQYVKSFNFFILYLHMSYTLFVFLVSADKKSDDTYKISWR